LAANEVARSFIHNPTRDQPPLGHGHRDQIRNLSTGQIRETYRRAVRQLINELAETEEFCRAGIVAIDITEDDPLTSNRTDDEDEIIGTKQKNDEYTSQ